MEEKNCFIEAGGEGVHARLDVFLKDKTPELSRTLVKDMILRGDVLVNGTKVKPHYKLKAGDKLQWTVPDAPESGLLPEDISLDIIFEDKDVIVLDKPSGMVVHPGAGNMTHTLVQALLFHTKELSSINKERPGIVHRLDKETSGVMVVAKNNPAHLALIKQFKKHSIERRYIALVTGKVSFDEGIVDVPLKRHYRIRKRLSGTKEVPRLIVHRSHSNIYAQFIDDMAQSTILSLSTNDQAFKKEFGAKGGNVEAAKKLGAYIAREVTKKGIQKIVFDRGGYLYHGRIKALADAAREAGLKF